jgi:small subunit ribosomal protein S1
VQFDKLEGFVPNSHIPMIKRSPNHEQINQTKQEMLGATLKVKAIEVDRQNERLIFSAQEAQKELRAERLQSLEVGEAISGTVANIVDFGLFIDLGGIDGLVHISELDWKTVTHPSQVARVGDEIEVKVIKIDFDRQHIGLSRKALLPDPWDEVEARYMPGHLVEVEITNIVDFGAFAQLPEGVQGLIHKTELGYNVPEGDDTVAPGVKVLVKVLKIDTARERIALSMQQVPMEKYFDWIAAESSEETEDGTMEDETL